MTTAKQLEKAIQQLNRTESKKALLRLKQRKAETRRKIELGGLIVKAGLDASPKDVILGALIDCTDNLNRDTDYYALCKHKGKAAFLENKE